MKRKSRTTFTDVARQLAWRAIEYVGEPDGRGGFNRPSDPSLDCDIELYDMARELLRRLPKRRSK